MLETRVWNGRNYRYPLKVHISRHREAFNELFRASYQINHLSTNKTSWVRNLLTSVQTNDPTICSSRTTIQADSAKKNDFEYAKGFILITAPAQKHQGTSNHSILNLSIKRGKVNIGTKTGVEVRYHKRHGWNKLLEDEQNEVR